MTDRERASAPPPRPKTTRRLLLWGTALGVLLIPATAFAFMLLLNESNPYCDSLGGGEDRIRCAIRFVGVTGLSILPETSIELFLVAVAIGVRCSFRWVAKPSAWRASPEQSVGLPQ
jgi:hypothetical protein